MSKAKVRVVELRRKCGASVLGRASCIQRMRLEVNPGFRLIIVLWKFLLRTAGVGCQELCSFSLLVLSASSGPPPAHLHVGARRGALTPGDINLQFSGGGRGCRLAGRSPTKAPVCVLFY